MEEKCVGKFEGIAVNSRRRTPTPVLTIITKTLKYSDINENITLFENRHLKQQQVQEQQQEYHLKDSEEEEEDNRKPSTSHNSMSSLLQEEFGTNSRHNFAEVLDDETTTSGVLEAFEVSSSNSLPTCTTATTNESIDSVAVHEDNSSSSDTIQIIKVTSDPSNNAGAHCVNGFFDTDVYVINDDDVDEDNDNFDVDDGEDDDDVDDDDDDDEVTGMNEVIQDGEEELDDFERVQNLNNVDIQASNEEEMLSSQSDQLVNLPADQLMFTNRQTDTMNGVIMGTNGSVIYLETPAVEEQLQQQQQEQQHLHVDAIHSADIEDFNEQENSKPTRLNDAFLKHDTLKEEPGLSSTAAAAITPNCKLTNSTNPDADNNNDVDCDTMPRNVSSKAQKCSVSLAHERLKNMNLDNCRRVSQDVPSSSAKVMSLFSMLDIESMDLIERRDYEHEQCLTGGLVWKSSSLITNDVLNLDVVRNKANAVTNAEEWPSSSNNLTNNNGKNSRQYSSDSKCTYKDLAVTPTSSRSSSARLTKSTAKMNLSITLSHNSPQLQQQQQHTVQCSNANSSSSTATSSSSSATTSSLSALSLKGTGCPSSNSNSNSNSNAASVIVEASTNAAAAATMAAPADIYSNSNSNDSFVGSTTSTASSTTSISSVVVAVPPPVERRSAVADMGPSSGMSQNKEQNNMCSAPIPSSPSIVTVRMLENDCSRTSAIQPLVGASNTTTTALSSAEATIEIQDDDVQPSTSSARCQSAPPPRNQRQVHASAQTIERYVTRSEGTGGGISSSSSSSSSNGNNHSISPGMGVVSVASVGAANLSISSLGASGRARNRRLDMLGHQQHQQQQVQLRHLKNNFNEELEHIRILSDHPHLVKHLDFSDEQDWTDYEENNSDIEEVCTCEHSATDSSHSSSLSSLNEVADDMDCSTMICGNGNGSGSGNVVGAGKDGNADLSNFIMSNLSISEEVSVSSEFMGTRKRKYNDTRLMDHDYNTPPLLLGNGSGDGSGGGGAGGNGVGGTSDTANCRKRIAYDFSATAQRSATSGGIIVNNQSPLITPSTSAHTLQQQLTNVVMSGPSPIGRRTPRSLIPSRDNPPPELQHWIAQFKSWSHAERLVAMDRLIELCEPTQVRHMMKVIEPQFQRDFISLLPRELALQVLSYLEPKDLLRAAQTCTSWRFLCDDNLLWKDKCRQAQILAEPGADRPKRGRAGSMPPIASPWKAAYMRQHIIEMNWRSRPVREPKVLKGHDEHVITCLQFSGNRIVSGSDDNTLKVWSAVTGRCLRTLVGHTGGVWSSQMSDNVIISGSTDRTLKVWNMETGLCVHTLLGHTSTVRCMHLHGNKVVSGSRDATLRVWDISQGVCLRVLVGHLAAVRCVQYDGRLIVSGAYDYMVKIWHPDRPECLHTLQGHTNRVYSLQFDGVHVVSGSLDTSIRVWDVETGNCKHTLMGHQSLTSGMELRENILVSGNADSTVKVWDITTGQCLQTLSGPNKHQSAVTCLQFNSRFVVTSSDDGTVKLWDVKTGEFIRNLVSLESGGSGGVVWRIRANDTKLICAVGSRNGTEETKLMVLDFDVEGACVKCS